MSEFHRLFANALDDLGDNDCNMERDRPYSGQPQTSTGQRGATEIAGVTFRDLRDAFIRAVFLSAGDQAPHWFEEAKKGPAAALCAADLYTLDLNRLDPMAIEQNLGCEIERLMGIYPNVPPLVPL